MEGNGPASSEIRPVMPITAPGAPCRRMGVMHYRVRCEWDNEAGVWYVVETDVPGLSAEAETQEALVEKLRVMIPELMALNRPAADDAADVPVTLLWEREQELRLRPR